MMIRFEATIEKFGQQGEKTGWTYIFVPAEHAQKLKPGDRRGFRVKGKLDQFVIEWVALLPMGEGNFIIPLNAAMRKQLRKSLGATIALELSIDSREHKPLPAFIECLKDEPLAWKQYNAIAPSHQNYFNKWIESAKKEETRAKRIAQTVTALAAGKHYAAMLQSIKTKDREK